MRINRRPVHDSTYNCFSSNDTDGKRDRKRRRLSADGLKSSSSRGEIPTKGAILDINKLYERLQEIKKLEKGTTGAKKLQEAITYLNEQERLLRSKIERERTLSIEARCGEHNNKGS